MKNMLVASCVALLLLLPLAYAEDILALNISIYKNDLVILNNYQVKEGTPDPYIAPGDYMLQLLASDKNTTILNQSMRVLFFVGEKNIDLNVTERYIRLPYSPNVRYVRLQHDNRTILFEELVICNNNGVCETAARGEFYANCPADCKSGSADNYCDRVSDKICDPDCIKTGGRDPDCGLATIVTQPMTLWIITVAAAASITFGLYIWWRRRRWARLAAKYSGGFRPAPQPASRLLAGRQVRVENAINTRGQIIFLWQKE